LKDLFYKHLAGKTSMGVTIPVSIEGSTALCASSSLILILIS
jgi:hypothetical protein